MSENACEDGEILFKVFHLILLFFRMVMGSHVVVRVLALKKKVFQLESQKSGNNAVLGLAGVVL